MLKNLYLLLLLSQSITYCMDEASSNTQRLIESGYSQDQLHNINPALVTPLFKCIYAQLKPLPQPSLENSPIAQETGPLLPDAHSAS